MIKYQEIKNISDTNRATGTSFYGNEITCTASELFEALWVEEPGDADSKTLYNWECELENGTIFTIYDYKHYRNFSIDEPINWHIGGFSHLDTITAKVAIEAHLKRII